MTGRPRAIAASLVLTLASAPAAAQAPPPPAAAYDTIMAPWDRTTGPGCALGVYHDGALVHARGYGMANLELRVPIEPSTVFYLGSLAKQFTATAVALLDRDGRLSLDDDIRRWVPEVPHYGDTIRIRHLLHHTGGLREKYALLSLAGWRDGDLVTIDDLLELVARQRAPDFRPGAEYAYSNTGYDLLAVIVSRAAGMPMERFAEERIFRPLGMSATRYVTDRRRLLRERADAYRSVGGAWLRDVPNVETIGGGGLYSNVLDLQRWVEALNTSAFGGPELVRQLETPGLLADGRSTGYAFGQSVKEWRGMRRIDHTGSLAGFRTALVRLPERRLGVAVLCNAASANPMALADRAIERMLRLPPVAAAVPVEPRRGNPTTPVRYDAGALRAFTGAFASAELGVTWRIALNGDSLVLSRRRSAHATLRPTAVPGELVGGGVTLRFDADRRGFQLGARPRGIRFERAAPRR